MIYFPRDDSYLLTKAVEKYAKNKKFLDLGSGSGIQVLTAKKAGVGSILASDINEESINHLKSQGIPAVKSNLFSNIKGRFDLVVFNPPYLPKDSRENKESQIATSGGKKGDETIIRFLKQSKSHLNKNGVILIILSSLTPKKRILKLLEKQNMACKIISSKRFFFETLEVWKIEKTKENNKI